MGKVIDHNNFWYIEKNPISKTGVFPYLGREIGLPGLIPDKLYNVLRSEKELMSPEAMKSFELLPITKGHKMLGPSEEGLTPAEKIPQQGIVGEKVFAEGDTLFANIKVTSEQAKEDINNGLKELSLGYFCEWAKESGQYKGQPYDIVQKNIRGNHLAIVPLGRMGHSVRVMDALPQSVGSYACDSLELAGPLLGNSPNHSLKVFAEDKERENITWITVKGNHIPIKDGENKQEAINNFFKDKKEDSTETAEATETTKAAGTSKTEGDKTKETVSPEQEKADKEQEEQKQREEAQKAIFTPSAELSKRFKQEVQNVLSDNSIPQNHLLDMGDMPPLYEKLGLPKQNLNIKKIIIRKALGLLTKKELQIYSNWHNHNVPRDVINRLPELLSDPLAVFESYTVAGRFMVALDAKAKGFQVVCILSPNSNGQGLTLIPSIHERDNFNYVVNQTINKNKALYIDKERASLPGILAQAIIIGNKAPTNKILTKEDIVKGYIEDLSSK